MVLRRVSEQVRSLLGEYPGVALVGPRQCGKTTLAKSIGSTYFDLEQEADRRRLDLNWDSVLERRDCVILDEAQSAPEVFTRLRGAIDAERQRYGRFLLLGSVSPAIMRTVSESLVGRIVVVELTPFLRCEIPGVSLEDHWLKGGYPDGGVMGGSNQSAFPRWQRSYLSLLSQRDLPSWGLPAKPMMTDRLMRMLAAEHGQRWNASKIGQSLGINFETVNSYLDYLEGAFLIRRLLPYHANLKKRLVKTPKVYWRDSGLVHALWQVSDFEDLLGRPSVGASFEGFVIDQILGLLAARGVSHTPYFFGTSDGYEIDLMIDRGRERIAVEVKLASQPDRRDCERFEKACDLAGAKRRYIVCRAKETSSFHGIEIGSLDQLAEAITKP